MVGTGNTGGTVGDDSGSKKNLFIPKGEGITEVTLCRNPKGITTYIGVKISTPKTLECGDKPASMEDMDTLCETIITNIDECVIGFGATIKKGNLFGTYVTFKNICEA